MNVFHMQSITILHLYLKKRRDLRARDRRRLIKHYSHLDRLPPHVKHMNRLVHLSDVDCLVNLRMDRNTFGRLCRLLKDVGGLRDGRYVFVEEQVAVFVGILAHHKKNRITRFNFLRSGETVSHYVHIVLQAIISVHTVLMPKPDPIAADNTDPRWKYFKVNEIAI